MDQYSDYPQVPALSTKAKKLLVMLHGLGSDGDDLISLVPYIQDELPDYHFISPHGIEPYDMAPYGRQWFSLKDRNSDVIIKLVSNNTEKVQNIIKHKQQELNLDNSDTVLCGFSQGTMLSSYLTLTQNEPFNAMIGFSGRLIPPSVIKNIKTPICLVHGLDDNVVEAEQSTKFAKFCEDNKIEHQIKLIPNLTHSIDSSGMEFAIKFLKKYQ
ncbi:MAG: hydrolase [Rickettsiales bacterium]|nr:MAG: hydrolase [Rickettsiales bacterium]